MKECGCLGCALNARVRIQSQARKDLANAGAVKSNVVIVRSIRLTGQNDRYVDSVAGVTGDVLLTGGDGEQLVRQRGGVGLLLMGVADNEGHWEERLGVHSDPGMCEEAEQGATLAVRHDRVENALALAR